MIPGEIDGAELAMLSGGDSGVISQLLAVGLLVPVQQAGAAEERYIMHPLIRAFALEHARESGERRDAAVKRPPGFTQAS
jgi:hypothetical protein